MIVVRLTASRPGQISFEARLSTPQRATVEATPRRRSRDARRERRRPRHDRGRTADDRRAALRRRAFACCRAAARAAASGDAVVVRGADSVTLLIAAATSYRRFDDVSGDPAAAVAAALDRAAVKSVDALRDAHVRDYRQLFDRVTLDLGPTSRAAMPVDQRVEAFAKGGDPALAALYFQYGRYLLIASSRPGSQPANLQGIWNDSLSPPWGSKYTININTQMNYWPALSTNLAETMDPLTALVQDLAVTGARTARDDVRRRRLGRASQHRPLAGDGADRWAAVGPVADRRRMAVGRTVGALRVQRRSRLPADDLSAAQRRGAVLPRHAGRGSDAASGS